VAEDGGPGDDEDEDYAAFAIHETMVRVATSDGSIPVFPDAPAPTLPSERGA
jgi:hypothetical protein